MSKKYRAQKRLLQNSAQKPVVRNEVEAEPNAQIQNGLADAIFGSSSPFGLQQLSQTDTLWANLRNYLVSNQRSQLSQAYIEIGVIRTVVDIPVDDAFRGGIEIKTKELSPEEIEQLQQTIEQEDDLGVLSEELKWDRLFGGGGVLIETGDDDLETPLQLSSIKKGDPLSFRAVDLWELFADKQNCENDGNPFDSPDVLTYLYYGKKIHKSRVLITKGLKAPSFIRPRMRGWGVSVVEVLIRSINQYLKASNLTFEVLDEFKVDVFKIKNLTNTLLSSDGMAKVQQRVALANQQKNFQNAITMDGEDDYIQKELSFAGLAETMIGIRMQVASDLRMPLTKVFGISAAGFSSGEDDIENYNAMVESTVRSKCKHHLIKMVKLRAQQLFGEAPTDITVSFKPLRILSSEQEENVKTQKFNRILQARQANEISAKDFRDACNKAQLLEIQLDPDEIVEQEEVEGDDGDEKGKPSQSSTPKSKLAPKQAEEAKI